MSSMLRSRWAAVGAAIAVSLGAGGLGLVHAETSSGEKPIYKPINPCRLADTRPAPDTVGTRTSPLGPEEPYTLMGWGTVGNCTLPNGTAGLALNVTAVDPSQPTYLTLYPTGASLPTTSNLNPWPGQPPTPNAVNVDLNGSGQFDVYNKYGNVHVIVDVVGYYDDHNHDDIYYRKTETYTKGEVDTALGAKANSSDLPVTMWAQISAAATGTILRQSGGITLSHAGSGNAYILTFPRDVSNCVYSASLGGATFLDSLAAAAGRWGISATVVLNQPTQVGVAVYDNDSASLTLLSAGFSLLVTCPSA